MSAARGVFDPDRLVGDLDALLPPPPPAVPPPTLALAPASDNHDDDAQGNAELPTQVADPLRPARGSGGRPTGTASRTGASPAGSSGMITVAARIPRPLYGQVVADLLTGAMDCPSYAQIVAWTCQDHPDQVLAELTRDAVIARAPRGRRLAIAAVQLTLRFEPDELRPLTALIERAGGREAKLTRTSGVVAALRVAVARGLNIPTSVGE